MTNENAQMDLTLWIWRLIAYIIDSVIAFIVASIIYYIVLLPLITPTVASALSGKVAGVAPWWAFYFLLPFIFGLIEVIYFVILDVYWGATIGKRLLGLKVQTTNGQKVAFDKAFIRNISKIYPLFVFLDWLIALITLGADKRQKYTDRIAGTTVVQANQPLQTITPNSSSSPPPSGTS